MPTDKMILLMAANRFKRLAGTDDANIVLAVAMPDGSTELIINPNADAKLSYIAQAYDDDLRLKTNPNIRISNYMFY